MVRYNNFAIPYSLRYQVHVISLFGHEAMPFLNFSLIARLIGDGSLLVGPKYQNYFFAQKIERRKK